MTFDQTAQARVAGLTVGIVGGTGDQGCGLGYRFARAGLPVLIGSRQSARATEVADEVNTRPGVRTPVRGAANDHVATAADIVIIAVPWSGHAATVAELAPALTSKIVVDCVNPLGFDSRGSFAVPVPEGSAAQQAASLLPEARVCAAFHHVSASLLNNPEVERLDLDVLVLGDDTDAVETVMALAERISGVRGVHAGRLRNAGQVEAFTANLITINRRYKTHAGLRVTAL